MRFKFFFLPRGCHIISLSPFEIQSNWFFILPCYPLACIVDLIDQVVKRDIYIKKKIQSIEAIVHVLSRGNRKIKKIRQFGEKEKRAK